MRPEIKTPPPRFHKGEGRGAQEKSGAHGALGLTPARPERVPRSAGTVGPRGGGEGAGARAPRRVFARPAGASPPPGEARAGHVRGRSAQRPRLSLRPAAQGSGPRPPRLAPEPPPSQGDIFGGGLHGAGPHGAGALAFSARGGRAEESSPFSAFLRRDTPAPPSLRYIRRLRARRRSSVVTGSSLTVVGALQ